MIIMVSGWMEEDEDDKRTFGVVPCDKNISLKVSCFLHCGIQLLAS